MTSGSEAEDQARLSRAYNQSIYLMVGMPYLLLGAVGYLIYRGVRQRALAERPAHPPLPAEVSRGPDGQGDRSCPLPSRGAAS